MSLPFVIDIAIGLIFIYLTLSLLASEIQELIAVVLQWRAEHLKKSIEVLIAGGGDNTKRTRAREIANELYAHPLINNLHQEAQGGLSTLFRKLDRILFSLLRQVTGNANLFGSKASGPSYIPPQTFAAGLIEYLGIPAIARWITAARFEAFKQETLKQVICTIKENLDSFSEPSQKYIKRELNALALRFDSTLEDFIGEKDRTAHQFRSDGNRFRDLY
ncbi:hypothetical protein HC928_18680 [bacterium]|nr:hypothetical protein [bacterium]